jgi:hypothetical protein
VYVPSRRVLTISAIALTGELAIAGSTLLPDAPVVSIAVAAFVLFPIALAVFARTIWVGVRGGRRPALSDRLAGLPAIAIVTFLAFFFAVSAVGGKSISEDRGQPTERAGHYYLNDHGDYIPVSRAEYRHAQVLTERAFTLIPSVFLAFALLINLPRRRPVTAEQPATRHKRSAEQPGRQTRDFS